MRAIASSKKAKSAQNLIKTNILLKCPFDCIGHARNVEHASTIVISFSVQC